MKPDPEYTRRLLEAFRDSPDPTTDIRELAGAGLDYRERRFEFHLRLLVDDGYVEADSRHGGIGLSKGADGAGMWSVIPLRLTATGHEFAEAMSSNKVVATLKKDFVGASLSTIKAVAVALTKAELGRITGIRL